MELHEKLQQLRTNRGLTQEELAQALYVSRTAISKWESGRGYPSIDSMKALSRFFSISIDDLVSGEKLLSIAETEHRSRIQNICVLLSGMADLFSLTLILLPLYPKMVNGYVYAVNLLSYTQTGRLNRTVYWAAYLALITIGTLTLVFRRRQADRTLQLLMKCSAGLGICTVLILVLAGETYAAAMAFLLLLVKGFALLQK